MAGPSPSLSTLVHGTALALAVDPDGPLAGVLIEGASGAGKSDLALRLIEACPWRRTLLVADDSVLVARQGGAVIATCPHRIEGLIEIRGVGISPVRQQRAVRLRAVVVLGEAVARLPEPQRRALPGTEGLSLPVIAIAPFELSAPVKLRYGVRSIIAERQ